MRQLGRLLPILLDSPRYQLYHGRRPLVHCMLYLIYANTAIYLVQYILVHSQLAFLFITIAKLLAPVASVTLDHPFGIHRG